MATGISRTGDHRLDPKGPWSSTLAPSWGHFNNATSHTFCGVMPDPDLFASGNEMEQLSYLTVLFYPSPVKKGKGVEANRNQ